MPWTQTTSPTRIRRKEGKLIAYPVKASSVIYEGDVVVLDTGTGRVESLAGTGQTTHIYVGIAAETVASGAADVTYVLVWQTGVFSFATTTANPVVGKRAWIDFTNGGPRTVAVPASDPTSGRRLPVGRVVGSDAAGEVLVKVDFDINATLVAS